MATSAQHTELWLWSTPAITINFDTTLWQLNDIQTRISPPAISSEQKQGLFRPTATYNCVQVNYSGDCQYCKMHLPLLKSVHHHFGCSVLSYGFVHCGEQSSDCCSLLLPMWFYFQRKLDVIIGLHISNCATNLIFFSSEFYIVRAQPLAHV